MAVEWEKLPFAEAIEYFRQKLTLPTYRWTDIWQEEHARSFVVAGALESQLLLDLQSSVDAAIAEGMSFNDFQNRFDDILDLRGWEPEQSRAWRARVIFETNIRVANAVGRYQQLTDPEMMKLRPYWQYRHSGKRPGREEHRAWNGLILRADDPFWDTHFPPNGWGCGCHLVALNDRDLKRYGRSGPDTVPKIETYQWRDEDSGRVEQVPVGIDPGWGYNPGKAGAKR